jgi:hypothetical protein
VALYPFSLIIMTYVLVIAYDQWYRLVVWMWRPVQRCVHNHHNLQNMHIKCIIFEQQVIEFKQVGVNITATHKVYRQGQIQLRRGTPPPPLLLTTNYNYACSVVLSSAIGSLILSQSVIAWLHLLIAPTGSFKLGIILNRGSPRDY